MKRQKRTIISIMTIMLVLCLALGQGGGVLTGWAASVTYLDEPTMEGAAIEDVYVNSTIISGTMDGSFTDENKNETVSAALHIFDTEKKLARSISKIPVGDDGAWSVDVNTEGITLEKGYTIMAVQEMIYSTTLVNELGDMENQTTPGFNGAYHDDVLLYTCYIYNWSHEMTTWESSNALIELPSYLTLVHNSVKFKGASSSKEGTGAGEYTYDESSGALTLYGGDLSGNGDDANYDVFFTFEVSAYVDTTDNEYAALSHSDLTLSPEPSWAISSAIWYRLRNVATTVVLDRPVTLTYHANYGTDSTQSDAYEQGNAIVVEDCMFTRSGYRFTGWDTDASGSETTYAAGDGIVLENDMDLYAQWRRTGGGSPSTTIPTDDNTTPVTDEADIPDEDVPLTAPENPGNPDEENTATVRIPEAPVPLGEGDATPVDASPKTGDEWPIMLLMLLLLTSGMFALVCVRKCRE